MEGLLSPVHLVIIMVIVLILFGPGKLPDLGKGLGKGIREFKDAIRGGIDGSSDKK
jgi:sec-independent protein translocase protein TatA